MARKPRTRKPSEIRADIKELKVEREFASDSVGMHRDRMNMHRAIVKEKDAEIIKQTELLRKSLLPSGRPGRR